MTSLTEPGRFAPLEALSIHWREFLIEGWALGMFMISAATVTTWLEHPGAPLNRAIGSPDVRLALIGLCMGGTAVALIYSPWGRLSGAHMNPAVTLAFLSLGRIAPVNAVFYIVAQFAGGYAGVLTSLALLGPYFQDPPVHYIVTSPGAAGSGVAFAAEFAISFVMMFAILTISNNSRWSRYTGVAAGALICSYVFFESPLSGFSMNPARTVASALPAGVWTGVWIYFTAPVGAMWLAARTFHALTPWSKRLHHFAKVVPPRR
jgi:aquaporin Z